MSEWQTKNLGDICEIIGGGTPSTKVEEYFEGDIAWLTPADLTDYKKKYISKGRRNLSKAGLDNSSAKLIPKGSVLYSSRAPIGYVAISEKPLATNQGFRSLVPNNKLNNEYLYYFLKSAKHEAEKLASGTTFKEISGKNLGKLKIPVPPLPTQNRIVEKIEELFSELDNGVENLKKAQQQLKTYRQAVLKDALEGDWDNVKVNNVCENVKVGVVIKPKQYYTEESDGIPAFRSANVREFRVEDSNWVYFTKEGHDANERTQLKEGDVLLVRSGYPGTSCVVPKKYEGSNAIDILIAEPNRKLVLPEYLCVFNNSPLGKGLFLSGSRGVAQKHLNVGVYKNLKLPLPPLREQECIVSRVEKSLSIVGKLEYTILENLQKAETLRQSILKKAFDGKLVI